MNWLEAIVLGLTQGLTEFLPISSSGHLIIVPWLFGWETPGLGFDAALHLGTLVAVFAYFWKDLLEMVKAIPIILRQRGALLRPGQSDSQETLFARLGLLLVIGSIPGGIAGLLAEQKIDDLFHSATHENRAIVVLAILMALFAVLLWYADRTSKENRPLSTVRLHDALIVGVAQAFALMPGVSRSGITLTAGLFRDFKRADAARFSFLLGIPLITVAGLKGLADLVQANPSGTEIGYLAAGMATAAISGFCAIWFLLRYLQTSSTAIFVIYRIVASIVLIGLVLSGFR